MIRALSNTKLADVLVIDIETVPLESNLASLSEEMQTAWELSRGEKRPDDMTPEQYFFDNAGLHAAFGKIICISVGCFTNGNGTLRIKSFGGDEESLLLESCFGMLNRTKRHWLVGHNIKQFDCPYICQRALVNGLNIPTVLDVSGKKPWEMNLIDTYELWQFGRRGAIGGLAALAPLFGLPSSKDDLHGGEVGITYWRDGDLTRIVNYCEKDVIVTAQLLLKFIGQPIIEKSHISIADPTIYAVNSTDDFFIPF